MTRRLGTAFESGQDNFLFLRFLAACLVILYHSYPIANLQSPRGDVTAAYAGTAAVAMFFVLSGFMVTHSYLNRDRFWFFIRSRVLRIFPALIVCIGLSTLLLGLFFSTLPLGDFIAHDQTQRYLIGNMSLSSLQWNLPGVFENNAQKNVINGSIWTLPSEARMYLWIALLGVLGVLKRTWLLHIAVLVIVGLHCIPSVHHVLLTNPQYNRQALMFILGVYCYIYRHRIPLHGGILLAMMVFTAAVWPGIDPTPHSITLLFLCTAYFCFWLAYWRPIRMPKIMGDCSYGVYLWGYPLQQIVSSMLAQHGVTPTPTLISLIALPLAILCGVVSWHMVEKPALALKRLSWRKPTPSPT